MSNSFNLYCQIYYLEARYYQKVSQFLLSATKFFLYESHLDLYVLFSFKWFKCAFTILGPPRDHLPRECYFWHWAQSHTIHAEQPAATRESIFLLPFSSFGRKCRLEVSALLKAMFLPSTALLTGPGDSKTRRDISVCQNYLVNFLIVGGRLFLLYT